jgi:hypothetical protein
MAKKKAAKKRKKSESGPLQKVAQAVLPGAKKRQTRRKKRRLNVKIAVNRVVRKVTGKKAAK